MSRDTDFLRRLGMPENLITKIQADLDQALAEADHLIDHALRLHRGDVETAAVEGLLIRSHIANHDEHQLRRLLAALIGRSGQLAAAVEDLSANSSHPQTPPTTAQDGQL